MSRTSVTPRPVRRWPAVVVALAAPLALVVILLAASWAPADGLAHVKAAVVNHDEPVTLEGQYTPLGRQLAGALVDGTEVDANYEWVVTDDADAAAGLDDGTYAAVVTIPENFSAAATSFASGDDVQQATIEITSPPGATAVDQAVAATVTTTATRVLGSQLTSTYVENVLVGFTTLGEQLGEAADGATQLAEGVGQLAQGTGQLATGADGLADGAGQLAGGTRELRSGSYDLATGTAQLAGGARTLADGAGALADGAGQSAAGARELADGLRRTADGSTGLGTLATAAGGLAGGIEASLTELRATLPLVEGGLAQADAAVQDLGCEADPTTEGCVDALVQRAVLTSQRATLNEQIAGLSEQLGYVQQIAGGLDLTVNGVPGDATQPGLVAGLQQLAGGAEQLAGGIEQLAGGTSDLATGASTLAGGASQLAGGSSQLAAGVAQLDGGAAQLADGSAQLADGVRQTSDGATQLADGTAELGTGLGQAVEQLPTTPEDQRADLAQVVTAPVAAPSATVSAPLGLVSTLVAVALWIGALVLFLVFRPLPVRVAGSTRSAFALVAGSLALPAAVSAVAGAAVGAVAGAITDQGAGRTLGLALVGAVAAVALAAFHQAVAAWFGTAGRVVAVVAGFAYLVAGLAATVPAWVGGSVGWLPLRATSDALGAVVGETPASLLGAVVALALWAVAGLLATVGAAARARQAVGPRTVAAYA
ncbi:YhgE/Pip family protein [Cellulomonas dongxiuzhuiae]|uniref:YhgE/Pip family protein n=1 Tax=Cellulomonas dongxiuzhuiae TaxID=2819979 RepID=A0ABX8GHG3_9CELL|nr:YhgE/Pip family protein [Cellulomonas dongxiuzhuiae]MBO3088066.1 YhgE/Pip family protein [Cellulomonas dongxiuzhuiae]MBO3094582.1 YhgE/Pip family protein [Cellulomonas dongxiuzhuiae]QWC15599.1 YhgE/Pip family protein [Cellulomonas dongxiuzhuiae]